MSLRVRWAAAALVTALLLAVVIVDRRQSAGRKTAEPTYAELVAQNYRVLSPRESRTLIRYAAAIHNCLQQDEVAVSEPKLKPTRIELSVIGPTPVSTVATALVTCGSSVGPPPAGTSLQARGRAVLLYLPRQCLLTHRLLTRQ